MVKIAVLASFNMDLVMRVERRPEAGETLQGEFAMHLGGKGFNQAVAARRLGADVVVCGRVGDDEFGRKFLEALDAEGIDRRAVVVDPEAGTGVATIYVEPDGTNTIVQAPRANRNVRPEDWTQDFGWHIDEFGHEHPGFFKDVDATLTTLETSIPAAQSFSKADYFCPITVLNAAPAEAVPLATVRSFSIVVVNELELEALSGIGIVDLASIERATVTVEGEPHAQTICVVTRGARGAATLRPHRKILHKGFAIRAVDTTGAGDAFCAALTVQLAESRDAKRDEGALFDAMRFANAAGALACTKHGAYPSMPYRREVEALLREQGSSR